MNLSGESLRAACDFFKVDPEEGLIVIYDDISLAPGQLRVRKNGSAGGHNGIKNIIAQLGTQNFLRVKVGVGQDLWTLRILQNRKIQSLSGCRILCNAAGRRSLSGVCGT